MHLRILVLSFYYPPDLCAGSFRCAAMVEALESRLGNNGCIDLYTTLPQRYSTYTAEAKPLEKKGRVTIHRLPLPSHHSGMIDQTKSYLFFAKSLQKQLKGKRYDVVFATSSRLMTAVLGAWTAKKLNAPLYLDVRDLFVDTITDLLPKGYALPIKPLLAFMERWAFQKAKGINFISKGFESYTSSRYPHLNPDWFTNGVDPEFTNFVVQKATSTPSKLTILYAGNIGEGQGLHDIIPMLAKALGSRAQFKIIGDGGKRNKLDQTLKTLGCNNVELIKPMQREKLIAAYQSADILFLHLNDYPAFRRVLPSKLFEYAATGKPILAGLDGYAATFLKQEVLNAAIFPPCDVIAAVNAFESLSVAPCDRQAFIEKYARKKIMQRMADKVCNLATP